MDIYNGKDSSDEAFKIYNDDLHSAIRDNGELTNYFKNNSSRLAAAKEFKLKAELEFLTKDKDGNKLSEKDYKKVAKATIKKYNRYQAAERNAAIHRNRTAQQWETFQQERELYPFIEWIRTRSVSPRDQHLKYAGRRWHIDDSFWQRNQPGCEWGCKCDWKTSDKGATDNSNIPEVAAAAGLKGNPYTTKKIFSDDHPYFTNVKPHVMSNGVLKNKDSIAYIEMEDAGRKFFVHYNA